ncbi:hypothetical protein FEM33_23375 [Dyadobacter flavalbus]|uniref:Uncharacterized protein n=1 Tax=Dyadobacter flavalbus TaxID=2579942 RepID=A0A5M8Q9L4_9BACT|nr:hypothetical protein [Dyadobacter flavalbus]KAA6432667.1 hypothetical protein FEM33_23375 [Dyadobacter flavalbus]
MDKGGPAGANSCKTLYSCYKQGAALRLVQNMRNAIAPEEQPVCRKFKTMFFLAPEEPSWEKRLTKEAPPGPFLIKTRNPCYKQEAALRLVQNMRNAIAPEEQSVCRMFKAM